MLMCIQNLVSASFPCSTEGRNSVKILRKMTGYYPKLDPVNVDVHTKFGQILSIFSQGIERKPNPDESRAVTLSKFGKK